MALRFADLLRSRLSTMGRMNILMVGLPAAGKTTILRYLDLGPIDTSLPAIESVELENINLAAWDVGRAEMAPQWRAYLDDTRALIFVVDSSTKERLSEAKHELHGILSEEELQDAVLLVFANKNDDVNAMDATHISDTLDMQSIQQRHWHVKSTCARTGDGLIKGIDWLSHKLQIIQEREIVGHVFHPKISEFISMLRMLRSGMDMGHHVVKPMNDLYEDDPRILFGKMTPNIMLKHQHCVSFTRSEAQAGGYIRKVTTGGQWKVNGSPTDITDEDKGVVVGEFRELTFVNTKGCHTSWKMLEFDTKPTTSALTICVVFNADSEIFKLYKTLEMALKRENDEGKDAVPPTVGESFRSGASKSKTQGKITRIRRSDLRLDERRGRNDLVSTIVAEDESDEDVSHEVPGGISSEEEEELTAEARARQLEKGKQKALDLLPPKKRLNKPQDRMHMPRGLSDSGIPVEVYVESLRTCRRNGAESSSRSRGESWVYETRSRVREKKQGMKEITMGRSNFESTKVVKALEEAGLRWGRRASRQNKTGGSKNKEVDAAEMLMMLQGRKKAITKFLSRLSAKKEMLILMAGLRGAGKRTILNQLNLGHIHIGVAENDINLTVWDVGGPDQIPSQWRRAWGLVFVVDSSSGDQKLLEASHELQSMLKQDELRDAVILVFANKKDVPNALNAAEITEKLGLDSIRQPYWHIESTCATSGEGLYEGLEWLSNNIANEA